MHKDTQPIDRETLLIEAKKIIREHEGLSPPALRSEMACWFSAEITF